MRHFMTTIKHRNPMRKVVVEKENGYAQITTGDSRPIVINCIIMIM